MIRETERKERRRLFIPFCSLTSFHLTRDRTLLALTKSLCCFKYPSFFPSLSCAFWDWQSPESHEQSHDLSNDFTPFLSGKKSMIKRKQLLLLKPAGEEEEASSSSAAFPLSSLSLSSFLSIHHHQPPPRRRTNGDQAVPTTPCLYSEKKRALGTTEKAKERRDLAQRRGGGERD